MHQIRFRLGLRPRPCWGSLQRSSIPPSCDALPLRKEGEGEGREGEGREEAEGRGGDGAGGKGSGEEGRGEGRNAFPHLFRLTLTTGGKFLSLP